MKKQPVTSLLAFKSKDIGKDEYEILSILKENNQQSFTYREVAKLLNWNEPVKAARRMSKLVENGFLTITGMKRDTTSNRLCQTYQFNFK